VVTLDTNVAFYALAREGEKAGPAKAVLKAADFLSVQVLNEYAHSVRRKLRREWTDIDGDLELLRDAIPAIHPIDARANREAIRIATRYQLQVYDALMIAVALENGATTLYSEDMRHGLVVDGTLTITNPFLPAGAV
jgi:predicted nucleic acid-binding protein